MTRVFPEYGYSDSTRGTRQINSINSIHRHTYDSGSCYVCVWCRHREAIISVASLVWKLHNSTMYTRLWTLSRFMRVYWRFPHPFDHLYATWYGSWSCLQMNSGGWYNIRWSVTHECKWFDPLYSLPMTDNL